MRTLSFTHVSDYFTYRWPVKLVIILTALMASLAGLVAPFLQQKFLSEQSYASLILCCLATFIYFLFFQLTQYISQNEATYVQEKVSQVLYKKILNLNSQSLSHKTVGEMVALYTTDIPSTTMWIEQSLPYILTTFIPLILTPLALKYFYSIALIDSFSLVILILIGNLLMARRQAFFFVQFKKLAAKRMGLVNEWIQNIKSLRLLNWIPSFEKMIIKQRILETQNRVSMVTNGQIMNSFSSSITYWLNLAVLTYFIIHHIDTIQKKDILILLWVLGVFLSRPLRQLPWMMTHFLDAKTSYLRLKDFLSITNKDPNIIVDKKPNDPSYLAQVQQLNLVINGTPLLHNIDLVLRKNEIVGLIGPVGSGKSLLMKCLLKEMAFTADSFYCDKTSYLSQEPFIFSSTIQNNVTFDYKQHLNPQMTLDVLDQVAFTTDLNTMPDRTNTLIGERGLTISGGQKQRLHLARTLFENSPVLLLDDPFSAVDTKTEHQLIQTLKKLKIKDHGLLVITQRYEFLKHCDRILFMNNGTIEFSGSYNELIKIPDYKKFIEVHVKTESESEIV